MTAATNWHETRKPHIEYYDSKLDSKQGPDKENARIQRVTCMSLKRTYATVVTFKRIFKSTLELTLLYNYTKALHLHSNFSIFYDIILYYTAFLHHEYYFFTVHANIQNLRHSLIQHGPLKQCLLHSKLHYCALQRSLML